MLEQKNGKINLLFGLNQQDGVKILKKNISQQN
jgi:hypothetical protein